MVVNSERVEHPRLHVIAQLFFDYLFVEIVDALFERFGLDLNSSVARARQSPYDVGRHEMIALAFLPPAPAAVRVLETIEPIETLLYHVVQLMQVLLAVRMRR